MDIKKIGSLLKELRKEKGLTQEQLAEEFYVSSRTVSRWETGSNLPDIDILIGLSEYYNVDIRELLDGERKGMAMEQQDKETILKAADYTAAETGKLMRMMRIIFLIGILTFILYAVLRFLGLNDTGGITEIIADFSQGFSFGVLLVGLGISTGYLQKIRKYILRRNSTER